MGHQVEGEEAADRQLSRLVVAAAAAEVHLSRGVGVEVGELLSPQGEEAAVVQAEEVDRLSLEAGEGATPEAALVLEEGAVGDREEAATVEAHSPLPREAVAAGRYSAGVARHHQRLVEVVEGPSREGGTASCSCCLLLLVVEVEGEEEVLSTAVEVEEEAAKEAALALTQVPHASYRAVAA